MITGNKMIAKRPADVLDRLRLAMSGGNFEVTALTDHSISFRHGTYLAQSAPLLPTRGVIMLVNSGDGTDVHYEIAPLWFAKFWLLLIATVFCWAVFPPILVHRALVHHPKRLMENLLQGI